MYSHRILCSIVFLYAVFLSYGEPNKTFRDYFFMESTGSFYRFHDSRHRSWPAALDVCISEGATLYVPQDEAEASALLNKVQKELELRRLPTIWIGVSNLKSNAVFETVDGRPINEVYNKWVSGYPNNTETEHCVYMNKNFMLRNYHCIYTFRFFCKYTPKDKTNDN